MQANRSLFVAIFLCLAACNADPAKGKSRASVGEAVSVGAPLAVPAGATVYEFSQAGSKLELVAAKVTRTHDGAFGTFSGKVVSSGGSAESSTVTVDVDVASLTTDEVRLTNHLKSADFLDVQQFPKATFVSTSVTAGGEKGATHTVTGNMTMHGVTRSVTFPATIRFTEGGVEADVEFAIDRKDFGIVYPGAPDDLIKDEVLLKLKIRARKAGA